MTDLDLRKHAESQALRYAKKCGALQSHVLRLSGLLQKFVVAATDYDDTPPSHIVDEARDAIAAAQMTSRESV